MYLLSYEMFKTTSSVKMCKLYVHLTPWKHHSPMPCFPELPLHMFDLLDLVLHRLHARSPLALFCLAASPYM